MSVFERFFDLISAFVAVIAGYIFATWTKIVIDDMKYYAEKSNELLYCICIRLAIMHNEDPLYFIAETSIYYEAAIGALSIRIILNFILFIATMVYLYSRAIVAMMVLLLFLVADGSNLNGDRHQSNQFTFLHGTSGVRKHYDNPTGTPLALPLDRLMIQFDQLIDV